jgi:hypothetical protein
MRKESASGRTGGNSGRPTLAILMTVAGVHRTARQVAFALGI